MPTAAEIRRSLQSGLDQAIEALRAAATEGLSAHELTDALKVAFRGRNQLDAAVSGAVGALDRATEREGQENTCGLKCSSWLTYNLNISPNAAHAQVALARQLPSLPLVKGLFEDGELSAQHASVISRIVEQVERGGGNPKMAEVMMIRRAEHCDPKTLLRVGLSLVHMLAPREMEADEEQRQRARYLHMPEAFNGGHDLEGYLDPEGGALLKRAIEAVLGPRQKGDERRPSQRRADGLVEIARRILDRGDMPRRGGQRPHITITATLETLLGNPGAPAALLDWGFPISGKALRRIARDAEITPILVNERGDPLRVGRKYRTATPKMLRALAERDRRCVWPGCDRPPEWCQGNHEDPWARGGRTDVDRMGLLCTQHHGLLAQGWRLERRADRRVIVHPPGRAQVRAP